MTLTEYQRTHQLSDRHACKLIFSMQFLGIDNAKMTCWRDTLISQGMTKEQAKKEIFDSVQIDDEVADRIVELVKTFC